MHDQAEVETTGAARDETDPSRRPGGTCRSMHPVASPDPKARGNDVSVERVR